MKYRTKLLTVLLIIPLPISALSWGQTQLMQRDLFHQGENGVNTYRIPALIETAKGTLIAIGDARHDSARDLPGHISLVMRRSSNRGEDWEPTRTIQEVKEGGVGDASLLQDRSNGRVWCFFSYGPPGISFWNAVPGSATGPTTLQVRAMHSDDDGANWSMPVDLTAQLKKPIWQALFATSGTDIQTSTGRFLVPLVVRDEKGVIHSLNAYSDDHGETWKTGELIGTGTDESHNVELKNGVILQNMRNGKSRAIAFSHDGGATFDSVTHDAALIDPSCNAGITRYRLGSTDVLIFTNAASTQRENLTVKLSYDGGQTWPVARLLNPGPSSYSTVIQLSDGSIGVFYERGNAYPAEKLTFARFSMDWVKGRR
jgi:sialidase-1